MNMTPIAFECDRCHKPVSGGYEIDRETAFTSGYYLVDAGSWHVFARPGEIRICDACMHADPAYLKTFSSPNLTPVSSNNTVELNSNNNQQKEK